MRAFWIIALLSSAAQAKTGLPDERVLVQRLDAILAARAPDLDTARVGIIVVDLYTGRPLYQLRQAEPFNLASNVKLFTTAAALARLGREYSFTTALLADAPPDDNGVVDGNLYLRAGGDPSLNLAALAELAGELRRLGVKKASGKLIVDDSFFDDDITPPAFDQKNEDVAFRAPVSAASLNYNAVTVWVQPGVKAGAPARVVLETPGDYFKVENGAITVDTGHTELSVATKVLARQTQITVRGQIRRDDRDGEAFGRPVWHPSLYVGSVLRAELTRAGVQVKHGVERGVTPHTARLLARHDSEELVTLIRAADLKSINFVAEDLLKTLGAEVGGPPGTWAKGKAVVAQYLKEIGILPGSYRYDNGSGLYDSNRFTPEQAVVLLRAAYLDFRLGPDFVAALPLAGADGTLWRRMQGTAAERYLRAKTGTLKTVKTLAGYVGGVGKSPLAFAIFVNDIPDREPAMAAARGLEDEVAEQLALYVDSM